MIEKITKNCMGTLDITAKFNGMRKAQEFIVYPIKADDSPNRLLVQSDSRIGYIYLNSGVVEMSPARSGGSYAPHLMFRKVIDNLSTEEIAGIKFRLVQTADKMAGSNGAHVFCDNSGASGISIFNMAQ
jgi:hypothetical protein